MEKNNLDIQNLIAPFRAFLVEGFNLFGVGEDDLPHLICAGPDRQTARAIGSLLTIAKRAEMLQATTAEINSNCYLTPMLLADGTPALVASVINDVVVRDGNEVEYEGLELHLGSAGYEGLFKQFLIEQPESPVRELHVYESSLLQSVDPNGEFPF